MPSGLFGPDALITPFFQLAVILQLHLLLGKRVPCETILGWGPRKALGLDCLTVAGHSVFSPRCKFPAKTQEMEMSSKRRLSSRGRRL